MQSLHDAGIVHFDLKPGNVLLDAQGRACVCDLGFATLVGRRPRLVAGVSKPKNAGLTWAYAPPELFSRAVSLAPDSFDFTDFTSLKLRTNHRVVSWKGGLFGVGQVSGCVQLWYRVVRARDAATGMAGPQ